jgi:hypothetical protein
MDEFENNLHVKIKMNMQWLILLPSDGEIAPITVLKDGI